MTKEEINSLRDHMHEMWSAIQHSLDTDHDIDPDVEIQAVKFRNALDVAERAARNLLEEL